MQQRLLLAALVAVVALVPNTVLAEDVARTPLPKDHPLVGTWKIDLPRVSCFEVYEVRPDGTTRVTSREEVAESEFELSLSPSSRGFYKWVDKITKDNGKPDCMGSTMQIGHVATNYISIHKLGKMFLMCEQEDLNTCIGPFVRQEGI